MIKKLLASLLAVAFCAGLAGAAARADDATAVRVGASPIDPGAEPYYADEMGFFTKAGLKATVTTVPNANAMVASIVSGGIDVGFLGINVIEEAYAKGVPLVIIAPAAVVDSTRRVVYMMVRNGVPITTAKDFEGKTIGSSPLRSIGELAMDLWIDKNGGDSSKVKYLDLPFPAVPWRCSRAASTVRSSSSRSPSMSKPYATTIGPDPMTVVGDGALGNAFACTKAWAMAHPDLVAKFAAAMRDTADWANKNPDQSATIPRSTATPPSR